MLLEDSAHGCVRHVGMLHGNVDVDSSCILRTSLGVGQEMYPRVEFCLVGDLSCITFI